MHKKKRRFLLILLAAVFILQGCGEKKAGLTDGREVYVKEDTSEEEAVKEEEEKTEQELFLVTGLNTEQRKITLKGCEEQEEKEYSYTDATCLKDKYGNDIAMEKLSAGEMVKVRIDRGTVKLIRISDEIFTYADVHNFALNLEEKTITVGKTTYYYGEDVQVFYRNNKISLGEISKWDTLCLKGIDKKVYAVQVTNGHGTVVLQNTDVFVGGNVTIGNVRSLDIEPDMRIEMPEGKWLLSVANDGYGGSTEVTVEANREVTVDLEPLKGDGPKYCTLTFSIEPGNAVLYLNGEVVDLSQPIQLKYGRYRLSAKADGYADWKRILVVNSRNANVKIEMQTEEAETEESEEAEEEISTTAEEEGALEESLRELIEELKEDTVSNTDSSDTMNNLLGID